MPLILLTPSLVYSEYRPVQFRDIGLVRIIRLLFPVAVFAFIALFPILLIAFLIHVPPAKIRKVIFFVP